MSCTPNSLCFETARLLQKRETPHTDPPIYLHVSDGEDTTSPPTPSKDEEDVVAQDESAAPALIYPEGGRDAWLVVFGSFSGLLGVLGIMNSVGTFQAYIANNQLRDYSEADIGWIFGLYAFLAFFGGVQVGPIFDTRGPRLLIAAGSALVLLSTFLLGSCTQYWHFLLVFGLLGGVGTSLMFTPSISSIGHWFMVRRGLATGIAICGGGLGGVIYPLMLQRLFTTTSFAWATRAMGFTFILLFAIANLFIRSRLPPKPGSSVLPSPRVFRSLPFTLTTVGTFFQEWGLFTPITYLTSYALHSKSMSTPLAYQLIAIFNAFSVLGRWLPGLIADHVGRYNTMILALLLCALSSLALWLPASILTASTIASPVLVRNLTIAFAALMGLGSGSNLSLTPVCVGQLCDTNEYGRYYASCYTVVSFATLTGIPIAGSLVRAAGDEYWAVVVFTGICYFVSFGAFTTVRVMKVGWGRGVY
ncbi:Riboflavin transporter MCH5 [Sphaceloma murrayae]|uniref:Riboflavin transporter MCH5 n=1 Tax=Sphaceloma murrayae TaxID=2082308 RepID=A0A2K1QTT8_9PEZI|nr:Riboflavin transporter MCH5 [Sphaceloma murrayae]